jgi:CheY-like chemotaxis protein
MGNEYVAVENTLHQGTRFTFSIPYKVSTIKSTQKLTNFNMTVLKNKRILIADDDEVYLKYLTTLMNQSGAQILTVKNGKEALEVIPIQLFDLILIDLKLPDIDGYDVAFQTRNTLNINRYTAIVGMSSGVSEKERQKASDMDDVLPKPLNAEGLINRLERVLVFEKSTFHFHKTFQLEAFDFDKKLNHLHLKALYGNDTEHAAMMFETFLEESILQWDDIWTLWENNNRMGLKEKAHRLKPAFSMVGLTQVETQLKDLERFSFEYSQAKLKDILTTIDNTIATFAPILENELERLQCNYILEAA